MDLTFQQLDPADFGLSAGEIVFVSDVVEELEAARAAGMQAVLSVREGNPPAAADHGFVEIASFSNLQIATPQPANPDLSSN